MSDFPTKIPSPLSHTVRELKDAFEPTIKRSAAVLCLLLATLTKHLTSSRSFALAMASARYMHSSAAIALVKFHLQRRRDAPLALISEADTFEDAAERTDVLQWPEFKGEELSSKGIIVVSFTSVFPWFLRFCDIKTLGHYFHIVLEPSFAGYLDPDILSWTSKLDDPVFVQCTEETDRVALNALNTNLVPVSVGASNWVDHVAFRPPEQPVEKRYDCIYVANSAPFKRVFRYFKAVRNIVNGGHREFRAALACAGWGDRQQEIIEMAAYYGVEPYIDIHFALPQKDLIALIHQAKVNVLLSRKEGSNRSLFESMFCDLPSLCLADVVGPNRAYFNEYTGMLAEDSFLESALLKVVADADTYAPRLWALKNLRPAVTTRHIVEIIEQHQGKAISAKPVYIKINAPEGMYPNTDIKTVWGFNERLLKLFEYGNAVSNVAAEVDALEHDLLATYPELATLHNSSPYSL